MIKFTFGLTKNKSKSIYINMPSNMNTGRFRTRRDCYYKKDNQSLADIKNSNYYPCGQIPENDKNLVKHYKNYINRGLEHVPYLEKKSCIVRQRKGLRKKPVIIPNNNSNNSNNDVVAFSRLSNF